MKKLFFFFIIISIGFAASAQSRMIPSKQQRDYAIKKVRGIHQSETGIKEIPQPANKSTMLLTEEEIGYTRYDLQSNTSMQNRFHVFEDGTMGAVWTFGVSDPSFPERGTGYNYFDGAAWGEPPTARIESIRAGWPSYSPYGEDGELVVSHNFAIGTLFIETRAQKGTGTWTENILAGPSAVQISWPRAITSGADNNILQVITITWPTANGGPIYEGLDGALLYSRSADGGVSWDPQNIILDGMTANEYVGFTADMYEIIAKGDNVAFLVGDSWQDFFLMKSTDNGDTWTKTIIWENPYPFYAGGVTDTFYCVDGDHHLAFDSDNMVHVIFGINRAYADDAGSYWFPLVDGVGYWNENRPAFSNTMDALNPYLESGSELVEDYSLVGWAQDINANGTWDILGEVGLYYVGASSMPQIVIDDMDRIFIVYASVTETYNNGTQDYRHLWARYSPNGDWWGSKFVDLNADLIHIFDECVFPSVSVNMDDNFYLIYQTDIEPGLAVRGDGDDYTDNKIWCMSVPVTDPYVGIHDDLTFNDFDVMQNYPNPAFESTTINVNIRKTASVSIEIANLMGQRILTADAGILLPGMNRVTIDVSDLAPGTYFYTVRAGDVAVTKKMMVE
ncbi:MAG: T9SS type A sorting domain-containing protein [Bacteroidetes bacterium]|nr:T9SS type A sorting domain-containing protein [Bacteroidota bacterium]